MSMEVLSCPHCGAPLPARALREVLECAYCGRTLVPGAAARWSDLALDTAPPEGPYRGDGAERVRVGGRRFVVLGRVAEGDGCDVFFGRSDARLTELVLLKVARNRDAEAHLTRGWRALERLHESEAQGAEFFSTLLPQLVSFGPLKDRDGRLCAVFRWRSGFVHTFDDVRAAHPGGGRRQGRGVALEAHPGAPRVGAPQRVGARRRAPRAPPRERAGPRGHPDGLVRRDAQRAQRPRARCPCAAPRTARCTPTRSGTARPRPPAPTSR
jgi:hypothetical protein